MIKQKNKAVVKGQPDWLMNVRMSQSLSPLTVSRRTLLTGGLATAAMLFAGCAGRGSIKTDAFPKPVGTSHILKFAHVTDTHMDLGNPQSVYKLKRLVEVINRRHSDLDLVLFGGDNFNNNNEPGRDAQVFAQITGEIHCPVFLVRGNKEAATAAGSAGYGFDAFRQIAGKGLVFNQRDWKFSQNGYTVLGIDSPIDGADNGEFKPASMAFIKKELEENPQTPHIILNHHAFDNYWDGRAAGDLDKYVLGNSYAVQKELFTKPNLVLALSGHKHLNHVDKIGYTNLFATAGYLIDQSSGNDEDHRFRIVTLCQGGIQESEVSIL